MQAAADRYASMKSTAQAAVLAIGVALGGAGFGWAWRRISPGLRSAQQGRAGGKHRTHPLLLRRHRHDHRHRSLGAVRIDPLLLDHPFWDFLFGLKWSPQTAIRADQVGSTGAFGAIPLFTGTLMITLIAMLVALPVGLFAAIYMRSSRARASAT